MCLTAPCAQSLHNLPSRKIAVLYRTTLHYHDRVCLVVGCLGVVSHDTATEGRGGGGGVGVGVHTLHNVSPGGSYAEFVSTPNDVVGHENTQERMSTGSQRSKLEERRKRE